eukprot:CAMPEP_0181243818 /NCGR_PEP_ID=MMETSP1096-20121128/42490_1 /TAXON_ID=156174 ORGANISM="Chrysochromulina ericina, Strain CCMP281" /NCGR_SAMPLE_ID=MMETSP1096 /ASSEMBLY_ACC=CAM_ASM_000453 /LENGTH=32 /DNA_ID= /DNA_START= /DNA_END= /DNA_ORIENTATION=
MAACIKSTAQTGDVRSASLRALCVCAAASSAA